MEVAFPVSSWGYSSTSSPTFANEVPISDLHGSASSFNGAVPDLDVTKCLIDCTADHVELVGFDVVALDYGDGHVPSFDESIFDLLDSDEYDEQSDYHDPALASDHHSVETNIDQNDCVHIADEVVDDNDDDNGIPDLETVILEPVDSPSSPLSTRSANSGDVGPGSPTNSVIAVEWFDAPIESLLLDTDEVPPLEEVDGEEIVIRITSHGDVYAVADESSTAGSPASHMYSTVELPSPCAEVTVATTDVSSASPLYSPPSAASPLYSSLSSPSGSPGSSCHSPLGSRTPASSSCSSDEELFVPKPNYLSRKQSHPPTVYRSQSSKRRRISQISVTSSMSSNSSSGVSSLDEGESIEDVDIFEEEDLSLSAPSSFNTSVTSGDEEYPVPSTSRHRRQPEDSDSTAMAPPSTVPPQKKKGGRRPKFTPEDRKERKKEQNRTAAERYRLKRKAVEGEVSEEEQQLINENGELKTDVTKLEAEISCLKRLMKEMLKARGIEIPPAAKKKARRN